jgi:hypothetical protein
MSQLIGAVNSKPAPATIFLLPVCRLLNEAFPHQRFGFHTRAFPKASVLGLAVSVSAALLISLAR